MNEFVFTSPPPLIACVSIICLLVQCSSVLSLLQKPVNVRVRSGHDSIHVVKECQHFLGMARNYPAVFMCVSCAEARNRYRLDFRPSVCLSVCPSVTRWYCIKTAEHNTVLCLKAVIAIFCHFHFFTDYDITSNYASAVKFL